MERETSSIASRRSASPRAKKKNQIPFGLLGLIVLIAIGVWLGFKNPMLAVFWMTGIVFGHILQRSRFCFTASMRDPYLTGSTSITRAVLIAFAITTIGFTAIKYGAFIKAQPIPGMDYVVPISPATILGGFIFGIGMVIAGGCASGSLMRVGEGFGMNMVALAFFVVGSLWGAHDFGFWNLHLISKGVKVFLPDHLGWFGALTLQLLVILGLYIFAERYENKRKLQ